MAVSAKIRKNRERAAQASAANRANQTARPGTNLGLRVQTILTAGTGPGPRVTRVGSTSKGQGEWNVSPYYRTHATHDARWSATAHQNRSI